MHRGVAAEIYSPRLRRVLPILIGFLLTGLAALANHVLFFRRNAPPVSGAELARPLEAGTHGNQPRRDEGLVSLAATLVESIDDAVAGVMFDAFMESRESPDSARRIGDVVVVAVDEESIKRVGQWPWSRRDMGRLVERLNGARAMGFDVVFAMNDRLSPKNYLDFFREYGALDDSALPDRSYLLDNDAYFSRAIGRSGIGVALGFHLENGLPVPRGRIPFVRRYRLAARLPGGAEIDPADVWLRPADRGIFNIPELSASSPGPSGEGFLNGFSRDSDGIRRIPLFMRLERENPDRATPGLVCPAFPLELVRLGLGADGYLISLSSETREAPAPPGSGGERISRLHEVESVTITKTVPGGPPENLLTIPVNEMGELPVKDVGSGDIAQLPAWEVLEGMHGETLRGKYAVFGLSSNLIPARRAGRGDSSMSGVEEQGIVVNHLLSGDFIGWRQYSNYRLQQGFIIVSGVFMSVIMSFASPLLSLGAWLLSMAVLAAGNYFLLFRSGIVLGTTMPVFSALAVFFCRALLNALLLGRERRFIREAFSLNVSPGILDYLEKHPDRLSSLGGEQRDMTVLFSDIRGFTAMSEKMSANDLARFLNEYLTPMSDIVMSNLGTVDKFMGDAMMAFWNAPTDDPDHARNAAHSALAMRTALKRLQSGWDRRGMPQLAMGCGINSGVMFSGYMGSQRRKNYTVMGDNVNLASRLEGLTKTYHASIVVSHATRLAIGRGFTCRVLDKVRVAGRREPALIHELLGESRPDEAELEEIAAFEKAFELYQNRNFTQAEALLRDLAQLNPLPLYTMYLDRLAVYTALPPPDDWDGTFTVADGK